VIRLCSVHDRLHPQDRFTQPWQSFERIKAGQVLGQRHDGTPVVAEHDGWIVFPNPAAAVDQEWFYLAQASARLQG
jgi:succinylglutamate desuccinylase